MTRGRRRARRLRKALPPVNADLIEGASAGSVLSVFDESKVISGETLDARPVSEQYPRKLTTEELTGGKDDTQLTAELAAALRRIPVCNHCGGRHARACPRVKRMEFHPNGSLASVEFWAAGKWPEAEIIWQEDLAEAEAEAD